MPNPRFGKFNKDRAKDKGSPPSVPSGHRPDATPEKTAAWPGLPGKAQPGNRSAGVSKTRQSAKQEGV